MKENIIIFDCIETYPKKLKDYLEGLNPAEEFPAVDEAMVKYIESFDTYVYHCTRLKNKNDILQRGIKRVAYDEQIKNDFVSILKTISKDSYDFEKWVNDYEFKPGRGTTVHVTGTLSFIRKNEWCLPFFNYFGGEILIEIVQDNLNKIISDKTEVENKINEYKEKLKSIGTPCLVEIRVPVASLSRNYSNFFGELCRFYKNYSSEFKKKHIPEFSSFFTRDILPGKINKILNVSINDRNSTDELKYINIY